MNKEELVNQVKGLIGPDAEEVTVMWCSHNSAEGLTEIKDSAGEGALAAKIFEMLGRHSNAAAIIKALCKADKIKTDPKADLFSMIMAGFFPGKED